METEMNTEMMKDSQGRMVPVAIVKQADRQRDDLVRELFLQFDTIQQAMSDFRTVADRAINAHLELIQEQYGVKKGGQVGNLVLASYDGSLRIIRAVDKLIVFTDEIHAAKALIYECVHEWTDGARPELRAIVDAAFRQDKQGHLSVDRIVGLLRLEIADDRWQKAMQAIKDSMQVQSTRSYLRFYRRGADGEYCHIPSGL